MKIAGPGGASASGGELGLVAALFLLSRGFFWLIGLRFETTMVPLTMHLIDVELLRKALLESLWYLHIQPPLFNLVTGLILKAFPLDPLPAFHLFFLALGLLQALALYWLLRALSVSRPLSFFLTGAFLFSPTMGVYGHWYFYTYPTLTILLAAAVCLWKYARAGSFLWGSGFFFSLLALLMVRYLFHLSWFILVAAGVWTLLPRLRRTTLRSAALPLLLCLFWLGKNYLLFGTFTNSTWLGWSLSKVTTQFLDEAGKQRLIAEGAVSPLVLIYPGNSLGRYRDYLDRTGRRSHPVEALRQETKSTGGYNYDNVNYIALARQYEEDAFAVIRRRPDAYLRGIAHAFLWYFSPPTLHLYDNQRARIETYSRIWEIAGGSIGPARNPDAGLLDLWVLARQTSWGVVAGYFLLLAAYLHLRRRADGGLGGDAAGSIVLLFLAFTVLYVTVLGILLDFGENCRFRVLINPYSVVLFGVVIQRLLDARRVSRISRAAASR